MVAMLAILALAIPAMAQEESDAETVTIALNELNDSEVSGTARLSASGDQTDVAIRLTGAFGDHPNHIHANFCDAADPVPVLPLTHVVVGEADPDGFTNSTVDIPLDELLADDFSIIVHRSDDQLENYIACGNITTDDTESAAMPAADESANGQVAAETAEASVAELTTTGVGSTAGANLTLLAVLIGLAGVSAAIAISTAQKPRSW